MKADLRISVKDYSRRLRTATLAKNGHPVSLTRLMRALRKALVKSICGPSPG